MKRGVLKKISVVNFNFKNKSPIGFIINCNKNKLDSISFATLHTLLAYKISFSTFWATKQK